MKLVDRGEILGLAEYEAIRAQFRERVIAEKKTRRVQLGPKATGVFENHDTMLMQVQEMLRTERITREAAVRHEIETYNEIVPGADELSCTVMIEIVDKTERDEFLHAALGFEQHVWFVAGDERVRATAIDRGRPDNRTTAVHYLKFKLPTPLATALRSGAVVDAALEVDHPVYTVRAVLPRVTVASLSEDLRD
jgi:Protein of unknown function (DUF3501)